MKKRRQANPLSVAAKVISDCMFALETWGKQGVGIPDIKTEKPYKISPWEAHGEAVQFMCRVMHMQNCHTCHDLGCGDNTNEELKKKMTPTWHIKLNPSSDYSVTILAVTPEEAIRMFMATLSNEDRDMSFVVGDMAVKLRGDGETEWRDFVVGIAVRENNLTEEK